MLLFGYLRTAAIFIWERNETIAGDHFLLLGGSQIVARVRTATASCHATRKPEKWDTRMNCQRKEEEKKLYPAFFVLPKIPRDNKSINFLAGAKKSLFVDEFCYFGF